MPAPARQVSGLNIATRLKDWIRIAALLKRCHMGLLGNSGGIWQRRFPYLGMLLLTGSQQVPRDPHRD